MPSYDESKRAHVFGVYSGCPCTISLSKKYHTEDKNISKGAFTASVEDLINQWKNACDKYVPGPTVGSRVQENWNRKMKLPYGKHAFIGCVHDERSMGPSYCKFSLKEI
jgi:hypothetical protein